MNHGARRVWAERWRMTPALALAALAVLTLLGALAGCASLSQASARQTPRATSTPPPPTTAEGRFALRVRQAVGAAAKTVELAYHQDSDTVEVTATLVWSPAWKTDFAKAQSVAKSVCYETQAALWTSGAPLSKVTVTVLGQALDDYGTIITSAYAAATLTSSHASAISWSTTSADAVWSSYDEAFLRPLYGSDWMYPRPTTLPAQ